MSIFGKTPFIPQRSSNSFILYLNKEYKYDNTTTEYEFNFTMVIVFLMFLKNEYSSKKSLSKKC